MIRPSKIYITVVFLILIGCFALSCAYPEEVRDEALYWWAIRAIDSKDEDTQIKAVYTVGRLSKCRELPEGLLPEMMEVATTDFNKEVRYAATRTINEISYRIPDHELMAFFLEAAKDKDIRIRKAAIDALGDYVDTSDAALTALLNSLNDSKFAIRYMAARTLPHDEEYTDKTVPIFIEALGYPRYRENAVTQLGFIGESASEALPHLIAFLKGQPLNDYPEDRIFTIRPDPPPFVEIGEHELIEFLETNMPDSLILEEIEDIDADEIETMAGLGLFIVFRFHGDEEKIWHARTWQQCRGSAAFFLPMIESSTEVTQVLIDVLEETLSSQDWGLMSRAIDGLFVLGGNAAPAVGILTRVILDSEPDWVKTNAVQALGNIGLSARMAVPVLESILEKRAEGIDVDNLPRAYSVADAIVRIESDHYRDLDALINLLDHKDANVRFEAVYYIHSFDPAADEALPKLRELAESDPDEKIRDKAKNAIEKIEGTNSES